MSRRHSALTPRTTHGSFRADRTRGSPPEPATPPLDTTTLRYVAIIAPILLFSVIAHEIAHGYAALRQGDETALRAGRLSWNPVRHIDPFMTIILPIAMLLSPSQGVLAGAKPVPVDPRNYREYVRGDVIVSLAGVATNLGIALLCTVMIAVVWVLASLMPFGEAVFGAIQAMFIFGILLNLILVVFNLLPVPPLDGSHVVKHLMPPAMALRYQQVGARVGFLLLIALVIFWRGALSVLLAPAFHATSVLLSLVGSLVLPSARAWLPL